MLSTSSLLLVSGPFQLRVAVPIRAPSIGHIELFKNHSFELVCFYGILIIVGYSMPNPLYHHHHHVVPLSRISLALSRHFSLSFIASGRSSGPHPISSHSCWMYVWAGRPAFARPYVGFHRSTSLMSSSLLLQQWPACLVHLTLIVFMMGGRWPYSWCLVGCCHQDLSILLATLLCNCRLASSPAV